MRRLRQWIYRLWGTVRRVRHDADLEEELRLHLELAAEAEQRQGHSRQEAGRLARMRAGSVDHAMGSLRDQRGLPAVDALASDVVFGWRQLNKHRTASAVAVMSLGLSIGATTAAFRLVDAVLLRPLPVTDPDRLFVVSNTFIDIDRRPGYRDDYDYPTYREYSKTVGEHAAVMVVGVAARHPVVVRNRETPEIVTRQYLSGNVFSTLGLRPAMGRLLMPSDDTTPGAHPVAVVSHDYWLRAFGGDPGVVGSTFRSGNQRFEIVGVAPRGFTGTEPGAITDLFLPAMMNAQALDNPGWSWFRIWVKPKAGRSPEQIRQLLQTRLRAEQQERAKGFPPDTPKERIDEFLAAEIRLLPAGSGVSQAQKTFRRPLLILAALAAVVLLVACANVANLLTAQALARTREMALRVSLGAGRWRLIQLVLVESALLACIATAIGAIFAQWSAPLIVAMLAQVDRPVRLVLDLDWRALGVGVALALVVTLLFGLAPALRASAVNPLAALKGGEDPRAPRRLANLLIAAQMAFCVFLLFAAGLFAATFERLLNRPLGFSHANLLVVETESRTEHPPAVWSAVADQLRRLPAVESVAFAGWAPLTANRWRSPVRVPGRAVQSTSPYMLDVSPGYFATMRIGIAEGRDFRPDDAPPRKDQDTKPLPGVGIINEAFVRQYLEKAFPVGRLILINEIPVEIVGVVRDAAYFSVREQMPATVYLPIGPKDGGTLMVRTSASAVALAAALRQEVSRAQPSIRVRSVESQTAFVRQQMVRERLLATLSVFFAAVALVLAAIGLYGVLNYAVIRERREIGLRMALGAKATHIVVQLTVPLLAMLSLGSVIGLAGGLAFGHVVQTLLFGVRVMHPATMIAPVLTLVSAAALAALPAAVRAVGTDPAATLRTD